MVADGVLRIVVRCLSQTKKMACSHLSSVQQHTTQRTEHHVMVLFRLT